MKRSGGGGWAGLHVLADDDPRWPIAPVEQARAACAGGASVIQLRAKHVSDSQTVVWGREIRELTRACGARFIVNDRFDLALLCDADGVHLGQDDLAPEDLPEAARDLAIGRSTHTLEQARNAAAEAVDYVAFGPLFATASKASEYSERGLEALASAAAAVAPLPLIAIGGIEAANAAQVVGAGAAGAAVIGAVAASERPERAAAALAAILAGQATP